MSIQEILAELPRLPAEDLGLIAERARNLQEEKQTKPSPEAYNPRVTGLHEGAWAITDNFDDPLQFHPDLAATILYDPTEPASEDEWPAEAR